MPESELLDAGGPPRPDARADGAGAAAVLDRLAGAVERLLGEYEATRDRAARAEASHAQLSEALGDSEPGAADPEDVEERLQALVEENRRLRETLEEARERAARIRSRLMVVEDEL